MRLVFLNIYPGGSIARYLLSAYVLKAYLEAHGGTELEVEVLNFGPRAGIETMAGKLASLKPDVVGYSCYIWNIEKIIELVERLNGPSAPVQVLGGPEIMGSRPPELASRGIGDYYVEGEGERKIMTLLEFLGANGVGTRLDPPAGIGARRGRELVHVPQDMPVELADVPSVYLTGSLDERLYARQQAYLETQRGCRHKCAYCVYHKGLPKISYFPAERILAELDHLIVDKRITALRIFDAIFTSDLDRAKVFVRHLVDLRNRLEHRLPWIYWEFVYSGVDREFLELAAGLKYGADIRNCETAVAEDRPQVYSDLLKGYTVVNCIGVQSLNPESLKAVHRRPLHPAKFDRFMEDVRAANVVLKVDLIMGLPHETPDSFFSGVDFLLRRFEGTDHIVNIHRLQILPGSVLEGTAREMEFDYSEEAPHTVRATPHMNAQDMAQLSKLCGLLFRVVNSPLRPAFFRALGAGGMSTREFFEELLRRADRAEETATSRLVTEGEIDDVYWNDEIFREVPSVWLAAQLEDMQCLSRPTPRIPT